MAIPTAPAAGLQVATPHATHLHRGPPSLPCSAGEDTGSTGPSPTAHSVPDRMPCVHGPSNASTSAFVHFFLTHPLPLPPSLVPQTGAFLASPLPCPPLTRSPAARWMLCRCPQRQGGSGGETAWSAGRRGPTGERRHAAAAAAAAAAVAASAASVLWEQQGAGLGLGGNQGRRRSRTPGSAQRAGLRATWVIHAEATR